MRPERWEQIREVLEQALEPAPGERSVFLNRACSSDQSLRREVETLLASSERPPGQVNLIAFFDQVAFVASIRTENPNLPLDAVNHFQ